MDILRDDRKGRFEQEQVCAGFGLARLRSSSPKAIATPALAHRDALRAGGAQQAAGAAAGRCCTAHTGRGKHRPLVPPCGCWMAAGTGNASLRTTRALSPPASVSVPLGGGASIKEPESSPGALGCSEVSRASRGRRVPIAAPASPAQNRRPGWVRDVLSALCD